MQNHNVLLRLVIASLLVSGAFSLFPSDAHASTRRATDVRAFTAAGERLRSLRVFSASFDRGASLAAGDLDEDGLPEIVLGTGEEGEVRIVTPEGTRLRSSFPYGKSFHRGINVSVGDLDGDGSLEIVTVPMSGSANVRVFNGNLEPTFTPGFFAFDRKFLGGANVVVGDVTGDGKAEIAVGAGPGGGGHVRLFNRFGQPIGFDVFPFGKEHEGGVDVAIGDVDGDKVGELVTSIARYGEPRVKVYDVDRQKSILGYFLAYPKTHRGGVRVGTLDLDGDGVAEILTAPAAIGGPHVRAFDSKGNPKSTSFFPYERSFRGGVRLASADLDGDGNREILTAPSAIATEGRTDLFRYIDIDISEQRLRFYESGVKQGEHIISTGKWSLPTPLGTFKVQNHIATAYSRRYQLYMDYWMAVTPDGAYGVHALPYWKLKGGGKRYEGEEHLGLRVSHGCIRQSLTEAKRLFEWADNGTPISIHE